MPTDDPRIYNKECPRDLDEKLLEIRDKLYHGEMSQLHWANERKLLVEKCRTGAVPQ